MAPSSPGIRPIDPPSEVPSSVARRVKRCIDVLVAGGALVVLSPVLGIVALLIRAKMGSPVLFRQERAGHLCKAFTVVKFRTLLLPSQVGADVPEHELVTGLGEFLRKTSLDELPQLWNILRGDMSLVGPRPLVMEYLPHYSKEQLRRHAVPPGLTGWAQVKGRHLLSWDERFAHDVWYVDHWSLWLDLKIIAMTARRLFSGAGSTPPAMANFGAVSADDRPPAASPQ